MRDTAEEPIVILVTRGSRPRSDTRGLTTSDSMTVVRETAMADFNAGAASKAAVVAGARPAESKRLDFDALKSALVTPADLQVAERELRKIELTYTPEKVSSPYENLAAEHEAARPRASKR